jgi:5-hydroxyisourate hydrolase
MGKLTTHVLDTAQGRPGAGMKIELQLLDGGAWKELATVQTNADGRTGAPLLEGDAFRPGTYQLLFHVGAYFRAHGMKLHDPAFLDVVPVRFGIEDAGAHYHVPLLCSPWSYTTYRGS